MERRDDRPRLGHGRVDPAGDRSAHVVVPFRYVLPEGHEPLHGPVMERFREPRPLALLGVEHLGEEPIAVGREPRYLGCALVGHCEPRGRRRA